MVQRLAAFLHDRAVRWNRGMQCVWQFCTPKSASTYLHQILTHLLADEFVVRYWPVPQYGQRYQEVDLYRTALARLAWRRRGLYSGHLHTRYSDYLDKCVLGDGHRIIVQTRSIADTLVSIRDYLDRNDRQPFIHFADQEWQTLSDAERLDLLIQCYVPWHVDFLISWATQSRHDLFWLPYRELVSDTAGTVSSIMEFIGLPVGADKVQAAIAAVDGLGDKAQNKNVGRDGRGRAALTPEQMDRLRAQVALRAKSGVDLDRFI